MLKIFDENRSYVSYYYLKHRLKLLSGMIYEISKEDV